MDVNNLTDFFKLSAQLNLQLSATAVGRSNILAIILGRRQRGSPVNPEVLLKALEYLDDAYGERFPRVKALRDELETSFFRLQPIVERLAAHLLKTDHEAGLDFVTAYVLGQTTLALTRARSLSASFARTP